MIKANVISGYSNWKKIIKKPNDYFEKRLKQFSMNSPIQSFKNLLGEKVDPSFCGPCIHIPEKNYGTRSSLIIKITSKEHEFHYSNTSPDEPNWVDYKYLMPEVLK